MCTATKISKRKYLSALQSGCKKRQGQGTGNKWCTFKDSKKKLFANTSDSSTSQVRSSRSKALYFVKATPVIHSHYDTPSQNGVCLVSEFLKVAPEPFSGTLQVLLVMPWAVTSNSFDVAQWASEYPTIWGPSFDSWPSWGVLKLAEVCYTLLCVTPTVPGLSEGQKENTGDYKAKCRM